MKKIKFLFIFIAILQIAGLLVGCVNTEKGKQDKLNVVCTSFPSYDFVKNIGGENVCAELLLSPGTESHSYEPTPGDILKMQNCDLLLCVGGESESWLEKITDGLSGNIKIFSMFDCVKLLSEELIEGMEQEQEESEEEYDEHVWTSPVNAMQSQTEFVRLFAQLTEKNQIHIKRILKLM